MRESHNSRRQSSAGLAVKARVFLCGSFLQLTPARLPVRRTQTGRAARSRQVLARRENLLPDGRGAGLAAGHRVGWMKIRTFVRQVIRRSALRV
jgi:hypothetical protein